MKNSMGAVFGLFLACFIITAVIFALGGSSENENDSSNDQEQTENSETQTPIDVEIGAFIKEFDDNQLSAQNKYEGKSVKFSGFIDNISEGILGEKYVIVNPTSDEYYFGTSIQCYFDNENDLLTLKNGEKASFEGKFDTQSLNILIENCKVK